MTLKLQFANAIIQHIFHMLLPCIQTEAGGKHFLGETLVKMGVLIPAGLGHGLLAL